MRPVEVLMLGSFVASALLGVGVFGVLWSRARPNNRPADWERDAAVVGYGRWTHVLTLTTLPTIVIGMTVFAVWFDNLIELPRWSLAVVGVCGAFFLLMGPVFFYHFCTARVVIGSEGVVQYREFTRRHFGYDELRGIDRVRDTVVLQFAQAKPVRINVMMPGWWAAETVLVEHLLSHLPEEQRQQFLIAVYEDDEYDEHDALIDDWIDAFGGMGDDHDAED